MVIVQKTEPYTQGLTHPREIEQQAIYRTYAFGQFHLFYHDQSIKEPLWRRNKVKLLLKWFILNPGKLCSVDQFIDLCWPDTQLESAYSNLYVAIHHLRRLIEPTLTPRQESRFIHHQSNNFYWFEMDDTWWSDTAEVQHFFQTAKAFDLQGNDSKALFYYRKIINYCSLGLLPEDNTEEWLRPYRHHYEHIYAQTLTRLIQIYQQRDEREETLEYAYLTLSLDPHSKLAIQSMVDVYLKQGNISMAMFKLNAFSANLQHELGIDLRKDIYALSEKIIAAERHTL